MAENNFFRTAFNKVMGSIGLVTKAEAEAQFKALAIDPYRNYQTGSFNTDTKMGLKKSGVASFEMLREISKYDPLIRICITVIKKAVSQSEWKISPIDPSLPYDKKGIIYFNSLFTTQNNNNENMRTLLDRVIEDLLVLDAGVIEKVKDPKGIVVGLNSVDGSTIRPVYDVYGELGDPAYKQYIQNKPVAEFSMDELIYMMQNPQNDVKTFGYGMSPIESILLVVQASMQADLYNVKAFSENNIPPGLLDLGDMADDQAQRFIAQWDATVISNPRKMKFVWGNTGDKKFQQFQNTNKDMQYAEYTDWLSKVKLASFGLTGLDANLTQNINRATAQEQRNLSKARGVRSVKRLIEEYFNREIIKDQGFDNIEFKFEEVEDLADKKQQAEIDKIRIESGVCTPEEVRQREGFDISDVTQPEDQEEIDDNDETEAVDQYLSQDSEKSQKKYFRPLIK